MLIICDHIYFFVIFFPVFVACRYLLVSNATLHRPAFNTRQTQV